MLDPNSPHLYPRRTLLAVAGLSPQILTETLYALAVQQQPRFVPTDIHLITTSEGAERAQLSLLSEQPGWFFQLRRDYALPEITFDASHIHVLHDADGEPLPDLQTPEDNMRMADLIAARVRDLTADPERALHVSIAGGRKTMGYYAGYALSLFGRAQDRLSHVLVSEPYESSWNFFYPSPGSRVFETRDKALADAVNGRVTLAEIPFVRLRDGMPEPLQAGQISFADTIIAAQRAQQPPSLVVDRPARRVEASGELVSLRPSELAFYTLFSRQCQSGGPGLRWSDDGLAERYLEEYRAIAGADGGDTERAEDTLADGMTSEFFDERKTRVNRTLRKTLGPSLSARYCIAASGRRPHTRFQINLPPESIVIDGVNACELE